MSKVFLCAGHSTTVAGAVSQGANEAIENINFVNQAAAILSNQNLNGRQLVVVPHELDLVPAINWINQNTTDEAHDICIEVHMNAGGGTGIEVFYYAGSETSKAFAKELLDPLIKYTGLPSRGVKPDSSVSWGRLGFIRDTKPLAALIELGFIDTGDLWVARQKGAKALACAILNACGSTYVDHETIALAEAQAKAKIEAEKAVLVNTEKPLVYTPVYTPEIKEIKETKMESEKYELNLNDFIKAAKGSLYTFFGVFGLLIVGFAQDLANGTPDYTGLLFAVCAAFTSAVGNLFIRFFKEK